MHKKRKAITKAIGKEEIKYDARSKSFKETLRRLGYVKKDSLIYDNKKSGKITMSQRDIKTVNSVADAYRSMYANIEIDEDVLNEELIDSLIEETREEELLENIQSVIKKYPRDNDWKKLVMKHKRHVDAFKKGKDMPKKVEDEFLS